MKILFSISFILIASPIFGQITLGGGGLNYTPPTDPTFTTTEGQRGISKDTLGQIGGIDGHIFQDPSQNPVLVQGTRETSPVNSGAKSIKFALGTFYNTNFETHISNQSQKYGLTLNHTSNQIGATNDWNSKKYNSQINFWSKTSLKENVNFESNLTFENLGAYFFGDEDISNSNRNKDNLINYNIWNYKSRLSSSSIKRINWDAEFKGSNLFGVAGLGEQILTGNFEFKITNILSGFDFSLKNNLNSSKFEYSSLLRYRSLFYTQPIISFKHNPLEFKGGFTYFVQNQENNKTYFFPNFEMNYKIKDNILFVAGIKGDIKFNSFSSLLMENLYLNNNQSNFINQINPNQLFALIKGSIVPKSSDKRRAYNYQITIKYSDINYLPIFINGKRNSSREPLDFVIEYLGKDKPVKNFEFDASISGKFDDNWSNTLYVKNDNYFGEIGYSNIILKPSLYISDKISYNVKKWDFDLSFAYTGGLYGFQTKENRMVKMDDFTVINLAGNYQFNNSFRLEWNFNNLLNQKYQRIINYREIGFNFNAGVLYEF